MKNHWEKLSKLLVVSDSVILLIFIVVITAVVWQIRDVVVLKNQIQETNKTLDDRLASLEEKLNITSQASVELFQKIQEQQNLSADFADTIDDIAGTVGTLEKLSKTDKELLQKYSRVYFLSDNYVPIRLKTIAQEYTTDSTKVFQFHSSALNYLENMIEKAEANQITLKVTSAYRSFGAQSALKAGYLVTYGSGSNQFSADQGYSEHQLGTAVDLVTDIPNTNLTTTFENTPAFVWLTKNAHKYGFVLSYPKNNPYYQYEPWHWRFVGVKLATNLYREGMNFSDMDQREIDTYLVKIFD